MLPRYLATIGGITYLEIPLSSSSDGIRYLNWNQIKKDFNLFIIWHMFSFLPNGLDWVNFTPPLDYSDIKVFNKDINKVYVSGLTTLGDAYKPNVDAIKINNVFDDEVMLKAHYVDYYRYIEDGNCDFTSIYLCSELRDTLLQKISRYANMEYDKEFALNQILFALRSPKGRFLEGAYEEHIELYDNQKLYTVLDVFYILMKDPKAYFYPYNPRAPYDWKFNHELSSNFIFEGERTTKIPFSSLTWDVYRLNLYVDARIFGEVDFNRISKEYEGYDLPASITTVTYRRIFFMHVGAVQYRKLYIKVSPQTETLLKNIAIFRDRYGTYLDISMLGIYMFDKEANLDYPYEEEYDVKCQHIALTYLKKKHSPESFSKTVESFKKFYASLNTEQKLFLLKNRINEHGFVYDNVVWQENRKYFVVSETKRKWLENFAHFSGVGIAKKCYLTNEHIKSFLDYLNSFNRKNLKDQLKTVNDKRIEMAYSSMKRIHNKLLFTFRTDCSIGTHCMVPYLNDNGESK